MLEGMEAKISKKGEDDLEVFYPNNSSDLC